MGYEKRTLALLVFLAAFLIVALSLAAKAPAAPPPHDPLSALGPPGRTRTVTSHGRVWGCQEWHLAVKLGGRGPVRPAIVERCVELGRVPQPKRPRKPQPPGA